MPVLMDNNQFHVNTINTNRLNMFAYLLKKNNNSMNSGILCFFFVFTDHELFKKRVGLGEQRGLGRGILGERKVPLVFTALQDSGVAHRARVM